jgi:hypothetical protein
MLRRTLPALLTLWGAALLGLAVLDWSRYRVFLELVLLSR